MGRKHAVIANLASAALQAEDGKPRTQGRVRRSSGSCARCAHHPEERFPAASSGSRSRMFLADLIADCQKGIRLKPDTTCGMDSDAIRNQVRLKPDTTYAVGHLS